MDRSLCSNCCGNIDRSLVDRDFPKMQMNKQKRSPKTFKLKEQEEDSNPVECAKNQVNFLFEKYK